MSAPLLLAIGLVGGAGAVGRFLVDRAVGPRTAAGFPRGILVVNLSGTLLLGLLVGVAPDGDAYLLLGTGLLGAYTTFSTWMLDSQRLADRRTLAALNIVASLLLGLLAIWLGRELAAAL